MVSGSARVSSSRDKHETPLTTPKLGLIRHVERSVESSLYHLLPETAGSKSSSVLLLLGNYLAYSHFFASLFPYLTDGEK